MLGTFLSVLKEERAAKQKAIEQLDAGRPGASEGLVARFRAQLAELDAEIARVEASRR
jgi:hypothetical protein